MIFFIPGEIVALITFPGVIFHEIGHRLFCDLLHVPVYKICYFTYGTECGYVVHEPTDKAWKAFFITFGPLLINTLLCIILTFPFGLTKVLLGSAEWDKGYMYYLMVWLGFSIGIHAFPSKTDLSLFNRTLKENPFKWKISYFLISPIVIIT